MIDKLQGYSEVQLKSAMMAQQILHDNQVIGVTTSFSFGEPDVKFSEKAIKHTWRTQTWTSYEQYLELVLPEDWYDRVYLNGIGKVTYLNKTSLVVDAVPQPIDILRKDLQIEGFTVWKVKLPMYEMVPDGPATSWGWQRKKLSCSIAERYMVAVDTQNGQASVCYAAKHVNAAGANLKKTLMKQMQTIMGV